MNLRSTAKVSQPEDGTVVGILDMFVVKPYARSKSEFVCRCNWWQTFQVCFRVWIIFDIFWYVSESQISFLCAIMRYSDAVDSVVTLWILTSRYPNQALDNVHSVFLSFPTFPFFLPISLCWPKHLSLIIGQIGSAKLDASECIQWVWHTFLRSTFFQRLRWKLRRRVNMSSSWHRLFCFPYFDYVIHVINFAHPLFALVSL